MKNVYLWYVAVEGTKMAVVLGLATLTNTEPTSQQIVEPTSQDA
jgi:hypothetical protein